jgi:hypothetical protein
MDSSVTRSSWLIKKKLKTREERKKKSQKYTQKKIKEFPRAEHIPSLARCMSLCL